jgi:cell division FtsZ-interacting protein ZapD
MTRAKTNKFLFDDGDYFVALTDAPGVRIGIVGGTCFDIPAGHAWFDRVRDASIRAEVEALHDELTAAMA